MNALVDGIERFLDLTSARERLVTTNLANVDTPGYRTRDVAFQSEFQRAMQGPGAATPMVRSVPELIARPDGNDVSVDRETLLLAQTQLQFRMGIQLLRSEFRRTLLAINEGKQ